MGACRSNLGPIPVLGLRVEVRFAVFTLLPTVRGRNGGTMCCWRSERTNRIGARADRCLARCGRHFGSIYSQAMSVKNIAEIRLCSGHERIQRSHVRAVTCKGGGLLARDTGANISRKG